MNLLPWQQDLWNQWQGARHAGRLGHGILLQGPKGVGKLQLAQRMSQHLLCETGDACGHCRSCTLYLAGHHPDLYHIAPEGQQIKVDAVRGLIGKLEGTAHQGLARVAILEQAQAMNPTSANALLKTLEEPPAGVFLILVCEEGTKLLPTLISRCQLYTLPMPGWDAFEQYLGQDAAKLPDWPYWSRLLGGPLAVAQTIEEARFDDILNWQQGWRDSIASGLLDPSLAKVDGDDAFMVLKVLYFELLSLGSEPQQLARLYPLFQEVGALLQRLQRQAGLNPAATFQALLTRYQEING